MAHCLTLNIIFILYFPSIHFLSNTWYLISDTRLLVESKKSSNFVNIFMRFSQLLSCYQKLDSKNFLLFQKVDHISSNKRLNCKMISAFEKKTNGLTKYSSTQWLADCITSSGFISLSGAKPSNAFSGLIKVLHFNFSLKFIHKGQRTLYNAHISAPECCETWQWPPADLRVSPSCVVIIS